MVKRFMLIDSANSSSSKYPKAIESNKTNWQLCVLCQKDTGDVLQCPGRKTNPTIVSAYKSLATNLNEFRRIGCRPIDLDRLDNWSGIEATFETNLAGWHKTCLLKFSTHTSTLHKRSTCQAKSLEPTCFFCEKSAGPTGFREASTFYIDLSRESASALMNYKIL